MNRLSVEERARILASLCEGASIRATSRITGAAKGTIIRLLCDVGAACDWYQDANLRNLTSKRIQCDEIWSFCQSKERNVPKEHKGRWGYGDLWTWVAIDPDSKLVPCWAIGRRDVVQARYFIGDLAQRVSHRIQLTTDGLSWYREAVEEAFGGNVDFAQLIKIYGPDQSEDERRYSPPVVIEAIVKVINGNPSPDHITTSHVERQNLTMRMNMRRFTRLTNGFSKKAENLAYAVALHFMYYNFCRVHKTIKTTPAIKAGITNRIWTLRDLAELPDVLTASHAA